MSLVNQVSTEGQVLVSVARYLRKTPTSAQYRLIRRNCLVVDPGESVELVDWLMECGIPWKSVESDVVFKESQMCIRFEYYNDSIEFSVDIVGKNGVLLDAVFRLAAHKRGLVVKTAHA